MTGTEAEAETPPGTDRWHATHDKPREPGDVYTTLCGQTFSRGTEPPDIACAECFRVLVEACHDYAARMAEFSMGLQASHGVFKVMDDALARPGAARLFQFGPEDDDVPQTPDTTEETD